MRSIYAERRTLAYGLTLSADIARHLYTRQFEGAVVVLTRTPVATLSAVRKQWRKVMRQVMRERSSTLNVVRIKQLNEQLVHMQRMRFVTHTSSGALPADVYFTTPEQFVQQSFACHTAYLTIALKDNELQPIEGRIVRHGLLVLYDLG
jgi:hypothetical protein